MNNNDIIDEDDKQFLDKLNNRKIGTPESDKVEAEISEKYRLCAKGASVEEKNKDKKDQLYCINKKNKPLWIVINKLY